MKTKNKKKVEFIQQLYSKKLENLKSISYEDFSLIETYFLQWLLINYDSEYFIDDRNLFSIENKFKGVLKNYFVGLNKSNPGVSTNLKETISIVIKKLNISSNFIKYQGYRINRFFKITGMNSEESKILLNKYDLLKKLWSSFNDYGELTIDDVFPEDHYPFTCEGKEIKREKREKYFSYELPWILGCYQRKIKDDEMIEVEKKDQISNILELCILKIKYGVDSLSALNLKKNNNLSSDLANLLIEKGCNGKEDLKEISILLKNLPETEIPQKLYSEINYLMKPKPY